MYQAYQAAKNIIRSWQSKHFTIIALERPFDPADILLFSIAANFGRGLYRLEDHTFYDINFCYSLPLYLYIDFAEKLLKYFPDIVRFQLITLEKENEFLLLDVNEADDYSNFRRQFRYDLERNDREIEITLQNNLAEVLQEWRSFCKKRFRVIYPQSLLYLYEQIFSLDGFEAWTYTLNGETMAYQLVFCDYLHKINYCCMNIWKESFKHRSPGLYVYASLIKKCYETGYLFSSCYGSHAYKYRFFRQFLENGIRSLPEITY